jgi:hypothetical protein
VAEREYPVVVPVRRATGERPAGNPSAVGTVVGPMHRTKRLALTALVLIAVAACGGPAPAGSAPSSIEPAGVAAQRQVCGNLDVATCADAIASVSRQVPGTARSSVAVAATRDPDALLRRGGDLVVLVAFSPDGFPGQDLWFGPPTWAVTLGRLDTAPIVEPWRGATLPAGFLAVLRESGLGG